MSTSKIYMIYNSDLEKGYIGSTNLSLNTRFLIHKHSNLVHQRGRSEYCSRSSLLFSTPNVEIICLEQLPFVLDKEHLRILERVYQDKYSDVLINKNRSFITNREKSLSLNKASLNWYYRNREKVLERMKKKYDLSIKKN